MGVATIGSALLEKRLELGLEKGRAADQIGMSRTTYSSYEQDAQRPSVDVFPALAAFLNVSIEEFLSLYGATCIASVRASLDRLSPPHQDGLEVNIPISDVSSEGDSSTSPPEVSSSPPPLESALSATEEADESEISLELTEVGESAMSAPEEADVSEISLEVTEVGESTTADREVEAPRAPDSDAEVVAPRDWEMARSETWPDHKKSKKKKKKKKKK